MSKKKSSTSEWHPPADLGTAGLAPDEFRRLFRRCGWYVIAGAIVFAGLMALLSWMHYRAFFGGRFDLGNMVQAVYNTAHGRFLQTTTADLAPRQMSRLGIHVDPILAFFALPWLVWPSPVMLLVLQAVIVALAAWPAYRIAVHVLKDPRVAALLTGALLLFPPLQFAVLDEFHPVTLVIPFLLFAFLYMEEDKLWRALPFLVLAAICKEEIPLVIVLMALYFALRKRSWRPLLVAAGAAAYFVIAIWVIIPHFNHGASPFIGRYAAFGSSAGGVLKSLFTHPDRAIRDLAAYINLRYWFQLLWPFGFASLLSPLTLLIAAPEYLINGLSTQAAQRSIAFQYVAAEVPFLFAAAVFGVARLQRWFGVIRVGRRGQTARDRVRLETLALLVLVASLAGNYFMGPLPFSLPGAKYNGKLYAANGHDTVLNQAVKLIPKDAVITVNNNVGSHLSARRRVYVFPYVGDAQYVIVDETRPFWYDQINVKLHKEALGAIVADTSRFQIIFARDQVYVLKRISG